MIKRINQFPDRCSLRALRKTGYQRAVLKEPASSCHHGNHGWDDHQGL